MIHTLLHATGLPEPHQSGGGVTPRFAQRMARMQRSTIREILKITARKRRDLICWRIPAPEPLSHQEFTLAMQEL